MAYLRCRAQAPSCRWFAATRTQHAVRRHVTPPPRRQAVSFSDVALFVEQRPAGIFDVSSAMVAAEDAFRPVRDYPSRRHFALASAVAPPRRSLDMALVCRLSSMKRQLSAVQLAGQLPPYDCRLAGSGWQARRRRAAG